MQWGYGYVGGKVKSIKLIEMKTLSIDLIKKGIIILMLIICHGCEDDPIPESLPENSENGANTFGCLINEEIYIPDIRRMVCCEGQAVPMIVQFNEIPNGVFDVSTIRVVDDNDNVNDAEVSFLIDSIDLEGEYKINWGTVKFENVYYRVDSTMKSLVTFLKIDIEDKIISGTFEFSAYDWDNPSDTVEITDGRFDLKYE